MGRNDTERFQFGEDFQELLLRYTARDKDGYKALILYEDYYFSLIEHQIIAKAFKRYFKRKKRIPGDPAVLKEELRKLFMTRDLANNLTNKDKKLINKLTDTIYNKPLRDGESILEEAKRFASFVQMKKVLEGSDITDYHQYETIHKKIQKAINIGRDVEESKGQFLVEDVRKRHLDRKTRSNVYKTPFWQVNQFSNSNGYDQSSVFCLVGPDKFFKTGALINIARYYLKRRKKILYVDLENGETGLTIRAEQSLVGKSKREILSGVYDQQVQKLLRKYKRLGAELTIKRMPSYTTTADTIQQYIDEMYSQYGIRYDVIIVDYVGIMGSVSRKQDDFGRISDAYLDFKNLVSENKFESGWTGHHIKKEARKRIATKYRSEDVAKCIDIPRHLDALFGLNQNDLEKEDGIVRMEIVVQRDGKPEGRAYFEMNREHQRLNEMTRQAVDKVIKNQRDLYTEEELKEMKTGVSDI